MQTKTTKTNSHHTRNSLRSSSAINKEAAQQRFNQFHEMHSGLLDRFSQHQKLIQDYIYQVPIKRHENQQADCQRFLTWIASRQDITEAERDILNDQKSRRAVEFLAIQKCLAHFRFQSRLDGQTSFNVNSASHLTESIYLNPIHVWSTFETTTLLAEGTPVPASVIFFQVGETVKTLVPNQVGLELLRHLLSGPQRLRCLLRQTPKSERESLLITLKKLLQTGVIALSK